MNYSFTGTPEEMGIALEHFGLTEQRPFSAITQHAHAHFEICLLTKGNVEYLCGNQKYKLHPGSLCITRPGEIHSMKGVDESAWSAYFANIRCMTYKDIKAALLGSKVKVLEDMMGLCSVFEEIVKEANSPRFGTVKHIHALIVIILVELSRRLSGETNPQLQIPFSEPVSKAMVYISYRGMYSTTLHDIASHVDVSVSWLSTIFSRETKTSLRSHLRYVLIEKAKRQLEDGNLSVKAIADSLGFPDVPTFSAFFKRYEGCPPSAYRLRVQGSKVGLGVLNPVIFHPVPSS